MENQPNSKNIILNYGLYYGLTTIVISVIVYAMGMHLEQGIGSMLLGFVVMAAFIILASKEFKKANNGFMTWGEGVKIGLGTVLIGVLIAVIYQQIFINFIEPDFMAQMTEKTRQTLFDSGFTQEQIDAQMEMQEKFQGPVLMSAFALIGGAFAGFVIAAISAAIMKKSEEETY